MSSVVASLHLLSIVFLPLLHKGEVRGLGNEEVRVTWDSGLEAASHAELCRGKSIWEGSVAVHE